jgi:hypothetical protein
MMVRWMAVLAVVVAFAASGWVDAGTGADRRLRIPAALPADVPLPERAVLRTVRDLGSKGLNLVFETAEQPAAVQDGLRARLEAGGWALLSEVSLENGLFASYRKRGRSVALGVSRSGGVTVVGVAYQQPKPGQEGDQG